MNLKLYKIIATNWQKRKNEYKEGCCFLMLCCFRYTSWRKGGNGGPRSPWTSHGCPEREKWAIFVFNHLFELGYSDFPPKHTSFKETTDPFPSGFFYRIVVKISFQSSSTVCQEEKINCGSHRRKNNLNLTSILTLRNTRVPYPGS